GKKGLRATDFFTEEFECVRQGMADRIPERAQAESIQEHTHLMPHPNGAVLQVAVIKAEAGVDEDLLHAMPRGEFDLALEEIDHRPDGIGAEIEIADLADVVALNITKDDGGVVGGDQGEVFVEVSGAGQVQHVGAGLEPGATDSG